MAVYTDASKIASYLGVTLTAGQITQAGVMAQAASDWIDVYKGRSWQDDGAVTAEVQPVIGDAVWLDYYPIATVTSVETRQPVVSATWTTLAVGQYEIANAAAGMLRLTGWGQYEARVSYTHTATLPPAYIALAATMIAAAWLGPALLGLPSGLESVSLGQNDINVKFASAGRDVPPEALSLLGRRAVVIA